LELYFKVRSRTVLYRAWATVKHSGLSSTSPETNRKIKQFEENWINNIARIAKKLKDRNFEFGGERGITLPKGKGKQGHRPLVLAPVENRIVRRAILEVLQGFGDTTQGRSRYWPGVPAIRAIMETPTSVGGIPQRGVPHGLALIDLAVQQGRHWFARSDIRQFFTRVSPLDVTAFIRGAISDEAFLDLFQQALATNLINQDELEERRLFALFPDEKVGVAQGSALSALAGNISLREFDAQMNGRDIVCIRYIDDFIILGKSQSKVLSAYASARALLTKLGMDAYDLSDDAARGSGKVDAGNIYNGTDVLGYRVSGRSRQPCSAACNEYLRKVDQVINDCIREMGKAAKDGTFSHTDLYCHSLSRLHKITWGWSQSFRYSTARHVFSALDRQLDRRIANLEKQMVRLGASGADVRRRVMGIHLLIDTPRGELPRAPSDAALVETAAPEERGAA
jgi:RNA-directed DNA polymerase